MASILFKKAIKEAEEKTIDTNVASNELYKHFINIISKFSENTQNKLREEYRNIYQ